MALLRAEGSVSASPLGLRLTDLLPNASMYDLSCTACFDPSPSPLPLTSARPSLETSTQPFRQALRKALHTRPSIQHGGASLVVACLRLPCRVRVLTTLSLRLRFPCHAAQQAVQSFGRKVCRCSFWRLPRARRPSQQCWGCRRRWWA